MHWMTETFARRVYTLVIFRPAASVSLLQAACRSEDRGDQHETKKTCSLFTHQCPALRIEQVQQVEDLALFVLGRPAEIGGDERGRGDGLVLVAAQCSEGLFDGRV